MDITGTPGNDTLTGTSGNDIINGLGGDDLIQGLEGNDDLRGGDGNDLLNGGAGDDQLRGQAGSDIVNGGEGTDYIYASSGDTVDGGSGNDYLELDLSAETSDLTITYTDPANGTVSNGTSFQAVEDINLYSGSGNDSITLSAVSVNVTSYGQVAVVLGGAGNDTITGSDFDDYLEGQAGNDTLNGAAGNDDLRGGDGNDLLNGGAGSDQLRGQAGSDIVNGGEGTDYIYASSGDTVDGGSGNDYLELDLSAETSDLTITYIDPANGTVSNGTSFQAVEDINLYSGSGNDSITLSAVSANVTSYLSKLENLQELLLTM